MGRANYPYDTREVSQHLDLDWLVRGEEVPGVYYIVKHTSARERKYARTDARKNSRGTYNDAQTRSPCLPDDKFALYKIKETDTWRALKGRP